MNLQALSAPFPAEAIHWRAQAVFERNGDCKALALAYLDARDVMDRLDEVCGPENWTDYYDETASGRVLCKLSLQIDGQWICKSDGAGNTAVEGEKGGISDALKRAAVKWGIGRYLYDLKDVWAPCEAYQKNGKWHWKKWKPEADEIFRKALAGIRPTGPINDTTRDWIGGKLTSVGKNPQDLLRHLSPQSLKDLTYADLPAVQEYINSQRKAA